MSREELRSEIHDGVVFWGYERDDDLSRVLSRDETGKPRLDANKISMHETDGFEECYKCHSGVTSSDILDAARDPECRCRKTIVGVHLALLFRNLGCGRMKFMGRRSCDCVLHEQIVILFPSGKVLSKEQRSRLKE
jgi:hypothetical protein